MRYRLQPDGKVRQTVETSKDRGLTWVTSFVGLYSKKPDGDPGFDLSGVLKDAFLGRARPSGGTGATPTSTPASDPPALPAAPE